MLKEFREFIARGNVMDLAVGVIIGGAFGAIVKSLVDQVIMPPVGLITGGVDFAAMKLVLKGADPAKKVAEVAIGYGAFVNTVIDFLIVAFVIFLLVKAINSIKRQEAAAEAPPPGPTPTEALLAEIRDLLKAR
jgi:large conductance mechanosensitive channel